MAIQMLWSCSQAGNPQRKTIWLGLAEITEEFLAEFLACSLNTLIVVAPFFGGGPVKCGFCLAFLTCWEKYLQTNVICVQDAIPKRDLPPQKIYAVEDLPKYNNF